ncbi:bacillithiol biosynthesis cysteine-adding enzyme BshC [Deinococcus aquiradiocola]|uniref:bacillithiol biosynthesis cysteine-adding enzyme BshC n=1 Tax=Deinococcus aquiradiocola TaxID=393059 RepID=UPI00166C94B7|nr:bacillithiol biosynthesis cysteine-adding enzyme BshC [Deinococcus aquiradiocola]
MPTRPTETRSVARAYADGDLPEFFRLSPADLPGLAERATFRPDVDRAALVAALRAYHAALGTLDRPLEVQLERLLVPNSAVVVTGQQAGVLGGPAYSVHKGASAALLARELDRDDAPVLGVYWVASQDHDADEVAGTTLLDYSEVLHRLHLDLPQGVPVGRIPWTPGYTRQVHDLLAQFDTPAERRDAVRALLDWAMQGHSYADVFARLLHRLLGPTAARPDGLIVLDPLFPDLARLMAPALRRELTDPLESSRRIEVAAAALEARGFTPQLRRAPGATNLFLEEDGGQRVLLRFAGRTFDADGRSVTRAELDALLDAHPDCLTPAAGLRPAIQDALLPTLAFVVGPGEIAYGAQLREVYALHGLQQPLLWPRLSVTWLESNVDRLLGRFGVTAAAFQADPERALGEALARERGAGAASAERLTELRDLFARLAADLGALDPTLEGAAARTSTRTLLSVARLQDLSVRALARAENDRTRQLSRLKLHLLPAGTPQEREMNFLTYVLKHGHDPVRQLLSQAAGGSVTLRLE